MNLYCAMALVITVLGATPTERLLDARTRAYDANFRNDAAGLRQAISELDELANDREVGRMALYYAGWAEWGVAASEMQAKRTPAAIGAADRAVAYARRALERDDTDVEVITMLVNALIAVVVLDRPRRPLLAGEIARLRRHVIEIAPGNPRVVMMDAGMIFNNPPEYGGGQQKGLARWLEAIELLEREEVAAINDATRPRWGRALAYGWLSDLYLALTPPQHDKARAAATTALRLRPDFWYVKEQVLPKLTQ